MHTIYLRAALLLATACAVAGLSACQEKHEPVKPTVATGSTATTR